MIAATGPTAAQIAQVQSNLKNLQALNDYVYNEGASSRILNAYLLMTEPPPGDLGLNIGLNIVGGIFRAVGSIYGPVGAAVTSFLAGLFGSWASSPPVSLNSTFASLDIRLQQTSLALDAQLATFYQDVPGNWNASFTYNGQAQTLSSLANLSLPAETDPAFEKLAQAGIFALDQEIWRSALQGKFFITQFFYTEGRAWMPWGNDPNTPPVQGYEQFLKDYPAYYCTYAWADPDPGNMDPGWAVQPSNVGTGGYGGLVAAACEYLFIDSADGVVTNAAGLYHRAEVFNNIGIPKWPRPEKWPP
jgi:hypothetical protein